jgi:serine/threonine protein kinase
MPPDWDALTDRLGRCLADCGLVTPAQWREALARAGGPAECRTALDLLSRARAHWADPADPSPPRALTAYQKARVAEWLHAPHDPFPRDELVWNDYLLLEKAGEGGMGTVFKAWDRPHARYVAIKRTHGDSADVRRRLLREAELLRQLDHPNIARFYAREEFGETDLLVMEFLHGDTLGEVTRKRLTRKAPIPWPAVAEWAAELLNALDHLDGHNPAGVVVVHRDVKPANIMLERADDRYRPRLMDLGLGKTVGDEPERTGEGLTRRFQILGTPEFMAPEQWEGGEHAVPASDLYGLAGTLYFALTGRAPFGNMPTDMPKVAAMALMARRHGTDPRPAVTDLRPDVPPAMDDLLRRMLAVRLWERGTAAELRDEFRRIAADRPSGAGSGNFPPLKALPPDDRPTPTPARGPQPPAAPPGRPTAEGREESPGTGEVLAALRGWIGARLGGEAQKRAAARQGRELRRRGGAWLRAFARPTECPGRWAFFLALAGALGWAAGWGWAFALVCLLGGTVAFAHLFNE